MLVIRQSQMAALAMDRRRQFAERMAGHLRAHFHARLWAVPDHRLTERVMQTLDRARAYGIESERDCCRFLNLAVTFGWQFDRSRKLAWMQDILADALVSSASLRLDRVMSETLHRLEIAERNRRARPAPDPGAVQDAERADPYATIRVLAHKS